LTWPRQDYIARLEEEEKAPQQPAAACGCQGPATAMVPRRHGGRSGEGARAYHRCPAAHSPASKRPFDLQRSAATCVGCGGTLPPTRFASPRQRRVRHACAPPVSRYVPWSAIAVRQQRCPAGTSVGRSRTGRAQWRRGLPWVVVEERVKGRATGLRCDRATLRLAPEDAARPEPATAAPTGLCIARSALRLLHTRAGDTDTHVQAHGCREGVSMLLSRGAEARDGCEGDTTGRTSRDESPGRRLPYGLSSAPRPWLSWWTVTDRVRWFWCSQRLCNDPVDDWRAWLAAQWAMLMTP